MYVYILLYRDLSNILIMNEEFIFLNIQFFRNKFN